MQAEHAPVVAGMFVGYMKTDILCSGDEGGGILFVEAAEPYLFG